MDYPTSRGRIIISTYDSCIPFFLFSTFCWPNSISYLSTRDKTLAPISSSIKYPNISAILSLTNVIIPEGSAKIIPSLAVSSIFLYFP